MDPVPPAKVLVVDDEPFMIRLIEIVLERDGYRMVHAANGSDAHRPAALGLACLLGCPR